MLGHALAVVWRRQKSLDESGESLGFRSGILHESLNIFGPRREAEQIECRPADEGDSVGRGRDGESGGHLRHDERVDGVTLVCGGSRFLYWLISPHLVGLVLPVGPFRGQTAGGFNGHPVFRRPLGFVRLSDSLGA